MALASSEADARVAGKRPAQPSVHQANHNQGKAKTSITFSLGAAARSACRLAACLAQQAAKAGAQPLPQLALLAARAVTGRGATRDIGKCGPCYRCLWWQPGGAFHAGMLSPLGLPMALALVGPQAGDVLPHGLEPVGSAAQQAARGAACTQQQRDGAGGGGTCCQVCGAAHLLIAERRWPSTQAL